MMKVFPLVDLGSDWYPKNAFQTFKQYSSFEFVNKPEEADIIWIFSYYVSLDPLLSQSIFDRIRSLRYKRRKKELRDKLIIGSFHHLTKSKESLFLPWLKQVDRISDIVHFFSKRNVKENKHYFNSPIILLPYWIDTTKFQPLTSEGKRRLKRVLGLPQNRIIIGSFQRDTEADLTTPKLEKGPDIFCDVVESLNPDKYFVLLAGPRRNYIEGRLTRSGIPFKSLGQIPHDRMSELFNCLDYYLVTSRVEGGPQAILEAMATQTPIYSTPIGISDILSSDVVLSNVDEFVTALNKPYPDVIETHYEIVHQYECRKIIKLYDQTLKRVYEEYRRNKVDFYRNTGGVNWYNCPASPKVRQWSGIGFPGIIGEGGPTHDSEEMDCRPEARGSASGAEE